MTGTNKSTETNARGTVRKGHDVTLSDDVIVAIGSTLERMSLISLVKAFSGIKRYAPLYERLTRIPQQFNLLEDAHLKADVLTHFKCVTWTTRYNRPYVDEDYLEYLTGAFPEYLFDWTLDKSALKSFDALPDAITRLTMDIDENSRGYAAPKRWPAKLAELTINAEVTQLLCKPPSTLKRFVLWLTCGRIRCGAYIDAPLDLEYFELGGNISLETNHSISVNTLAVRCCANDESVYALINRCKGLQRFIIDDTEFKVPPEVREIGYVDCDGCIHNVTDVRTTSIQMTRSFVAGDLPHLTSLNLRFVDNFSDVLIPASVTNFEFDVHGMDGEFTEFFENQFENPAGIVCLYISYPYGEAALPSLEKWNSLKELTIQDCSIFDVCIDAPNIEKVEIPAGVTSITGQSLRKLDMCCPSDKMLPKFPESLEWLRLRGGFLGEFESTVELHAKGLVELHIDGTSIENVYYDSKSLRFVDNLNLEYIGPIGSSGTSKLPPYSLKWLGEKMKDYEFDASTPQLTLKINQDWNHELPAGLVMIELEISADYNPEDLAKMWAQTPKLKHITLKSEGDFSEAWLPSSAEYVHIAFKNTEEAKMKLNFDGDTTSLKWLTLENHQYNWESIGGRARHPQLLSCPT
ncbi:hypothetical protein DICA4_F02894 [Diutina catenulata]